MTSVDTTAGLVPAPEPGFGAPLAAVEELVATWDLHGAQAAARALLDEPALSPDDRLTARRLLAEALRELGDLDAAYDLAEAVAVQAEQAYGPSDVSTVHAWAVLAAVRHDYDEWDAAEALYHRVLDSGVDESDPEAARVIRLTRVNLALLQRDRGQRPLALAMLNAAYVVHRREYGADDLDTIRIAAELAALHHADGNVPASRRLFTLAHAAARSRLGNRHPFTKAVEWELAAVEPPMPASLLPPAVSVTRPARQLRPPIRPRLARRPRPLIRPPRRPSVPAADPPAPRASAPAADPPPPRASAPARGSGNVAPFGSGGRGGPSRPPRRSARRPCPACRPRSAGLPRPGSSIRAAGPLSTRTGTARQLRGTSPLPTWTPTPTAAPTISTSTSTLTLTLPRTSTLTSPRP